MYEHVWTNPIKTVQKNRRGLIMNDNGKKWNELQTWIRSRDPLGYLKQWEKKMKYIYRKYNGLSYQKTALLEYHTLRFEPHKFSHITFQLIDVFPHG